MSDDPAQQNASEYPLAKVYVGLRAKILAREPPDHTGLWGVMMETGYDKGIATVFALADGTASLYFSGGGGHIGMGNVPGPRAAAHSLLQSATPFLTKCDLTVETPYPLKGRTRFYILYDRRILTAEGAEADFGNNRLPLSPLFHKTHALIGEMLKAADKAEAARKKP